MNDLSPERTEELLQFISDSHEALDQHKTAREAIERVASELVEAGIDPIVVSNELGNAARDYRGEIQ